MYTLHSIYYEFEILKKELGKAEKYIFLEYFIIQEGVMWDEIFEILKRKVQEGVVVRIIYDDMFHKPRRKVKYPRNAYYILEIECVVKSYFI